MMPTSFPCDITTSAPTCFSAISRIASYTDSSGEIDHTLPGFAFKTCSTESLSVILELLLPGRSRPPDGGWLVLVHCPRTQNSCEDSAYFGVRKNLSSRFSYADFLTDIAKHVKCSNLRFFAKQVPNGILNFRELLAMI